jgi:hypothetical protein
MATQQLLAGKPGFLTVTLVDSNGDPVAATGALTVGVVSRSGAVIIAPGTATAAGTGLGGYQVAVTAALTAKVDRWTATWTDAGNSATQISDHEVCGGFFFSLTEARASDPVLGDTTKYPDKDILAKRALVEAEAEFICDVAFVPRYRRNLYDGSASPDLFLSDSRIRVIRSVQVTVVPGNVVTFTATQLTNVIIDDDFHVQRNDGGIWDEGRRNIAVEYEVGYDAVPTELKDAALLRLRSVLNRRKTSVPDRATSFVTEGGTTYRLDTPDAFATGIPEVDAVYNRYSTREFDDQDPVPVSRMIETQALWFSVYHGGRR